MEKIKIFFIPYAGGSSLAYMKWRNAFDERFELHFIELAGRCERYNECFYKDIDEAAEDVAKIIIDTIGNSKYYIFGHSMGALIAFEVYYKLLEKHIRLPEHIFFSGREAPQTPHSKEEIYKYEDEEFLRKISIYGGLPKELDNKELRDYFVPILKADFNILVKYDYEPKPEKIRCNISVLFGASDRTITMEGVEQWGEHAGNDINFYKFEGEHFFINKMYENIAEIIKEAVN